MAVILREYILASVRKGAFTMEREAIQQQAQQAVLPIPSAVRAGNCIAIYTMFILQDLLVQQTSNPITNFNNIIALATAIASLNSSIKPIQ
jgi:hypothetical protein